MRKLTRQSLDELAKTLPIIEKEVQRTYVGGGTGTSSDPYTIAEFENICNISSWTGGYVSNWGYVGPEMVVEKTNSNLNKKNPTGIVNYDVMYEGGYATGFHAGLNNTFIDFMEVVALSFVSAASAGSEVGNVEYAPIYYSMGLRDGYLDGKASR